MIAPLAGFLLVFPRCVQQSPPPERDPTPQELDDAVSSFGNSLREQQVEIAKEIAARVEQCGDAQLRSLLALRDRAVQELKLAPRRKPEFYDPAVEFGAARRFVHREPVDADSADAAEKRGLYRPFDNQPFYATRVTWDFGHDEAADWGTPIEPSGQLHNALHGYVPDCDRLVAWLTRRFHFAPEMNAVALHFDHLYCDLSGHAYPEVALYDAWSSGSGFDMPDVDVIAYARRILKDDSWVSPIPPDARRAKLYTSVSDGFLAWFRYRVWIEAAANLYVNPEAPLRENHEGLRARLLYLFAIEQGDVERIASRLAAFKTRDDFVAQIDELEKNDAEAAAKIARFRDERGAQGWIVARLAYGVLRERGLLAR